MLKDLPIGESIVILIVSALVLYTGKMTLDKWDAEQWSLMALGVAGTLFMFSILVAVVKNLVESSDSKDDK